MMNLRQVARTSAVTTQRQTCSCFRASTFSRARNCRSIRVFGSPQGGESQPEDVKKWKVLGMEVFESDSNLPEPQQDIWTGEKMEGVNTAMKAYLPLMFVLALCCGGVAARFFNDGASVYIRPAASDDALPESFYETPEGFVPMEENPLFK